VRKRKKGSAGRISNIPLPFEAWAYRVINPEIDSLCDEDLLVHYENYGKAGGLRCHQVADRLAFVSLIPASIHTLEIGPYARPLLSGPNVKYVDVYSTKELKKLAPAVGMNPNEVPHINWVSKPSDLSSVNEHFGAVLSSHVIEHQPDFIRHLNQISEILKFGGRYFVLIPDHRFCFDHFMTESTITDVIAAHLHRRKSHTAESLLESRLLMTHNDPIEHWRGNHGDPMINPHFPEANRIERLKIAINSYRKNKEYVKNEHAWYFTPDSFSSIMKDLADLELIDLKVERLYPTLKNSGEFWVILRSGED
jgi:SAM-dependent methyltransferase